MEQNTEPKEIRIEHTTRNEQLKEYIVQYQYDLLRLCRSLCRNHSDAEDLFQETWLKAIRSYSSYSIEKSFDKWLYSICVNTFKDNCKKWWSKKRFTFADNEEESSFLASIEDKTEPNEEYLELVRFISTLPRKYQSVITLRYFNDYSEADVAEILDIPVGTVKSRLHKAKQLIKGGWNK